MKFVRTHLHVITLHILILSTFPSAFAGDTEMVGCAGSLDIRFNPGSGVDHVDRFVFIEALVVLPNQQVLIGGGFSHVQGTPQQGLARLNPNGSLDSTFAPLLDDSVKAIARLSNGTLLIGGSFTHVNGVPKDHVARLNLDGSVDLTFDGPPGR